VVRFEQGDNLEALGGLQSAAKGKAAGAIMTTRWRPTFDPDVLYFITTTTVQRKRFFNHVGSKRLLVDALYYVSLMNNVSLYAFVVMPNHIHIMIKCPATCPFKDWVRAFKASTAQLLVRSCQVRGDNAMLKKMEAAVTRPKKQRYKVWEDGYLAKSVFSPKFLRQKMTYIHNNPVQAHWQLAETPEAYP